MPALASLNHHFAIPDHLAFTASDYGLPVAEIDNELASATIALQGAHVMTFQPHGEAPVLWLSEQARLQPGKAVRGGIPICWPWFGAHATDTGFPAHGFARILNWRVIVSEALADGSTRVAFELQKNATARAQWPYICHLRCIVTVGLALTVELITENTGDTAFELSEALHTYFAVGDIENIRILGLDGCSYFDKLDGGTRIQRGPIDIHTEVDRVFMDTISDCVIEDSLLKRRIRIAKSGSRSTVVWNPWAAKASRMGDMGENGYRSMVCVESANAMNSLVTLAPGDTHHLRAVYSVEAL
ncbi:MAG TPA: D-hexose-6-phosphate mutarotase [Novimethylophilus sp.]|jgi:D-hexose-6-phosphate mutarotase|uniref:D-hexose-6-phosphate mutarotase n=1 Tax=Novimethylophilus sp. TaxID=2137426 RepID=UPI002F417BED